MGWESIKKRIDFLGLCIFQKIHRQESRPLVRKCLPKWDTEKIRMTRSRGGYTPYPNLGHKFLNSFFPYISKLWNNLPVSMKILDVKEFKQQLKLQLKPTKFKVFSVGPKFSNSILTRLRTGRTGLNLDKFTLGQICDPGCLCHYKSESSEHYLLDCFLYTVERQNLYNQVEHYIPNFSKLTKKAKYSILTEGIKTCDPEFHYTNVRISLATQHFIVKTNRFS